jgi:hypothetical protein
MKRILRALRWVGALVGIAVLTNGGYFFYSLASAQGRVKPLCAQLHGKALPELEAISAANGFTKPTLAPGMDTGFIAERRSFGRFGCKLVFEGGYVQSAEYFAMD